MSVFSVLIKPASSLCNLRCRYCFYADVSSSREIKSYGIMSRETAHLLIDRCFEKNPVGTVNFAFQGGEPTVAGLGFFKDFTAYAQQTCPKTCTVAYAIQTNGTLLTEEFCALLRQFRFLVGLSLDGYEEVHDFNRIDAEKQPTFAKVTAAAKMLAAHGVDFNILTVLTRQLAKHPAQLFSFYKKNGYDYVQIIPCLSALNETGQDVFSLTPELFASFYKAFFKLWADEYQRGHYISVRLFDNLIGMLAGRAPELCGMLGSCSAQFVVEADGGIYPCDFYVLDEYLCGNIHSQSFLQIAQSDAMRDYLRQGENKNALCGTCRAYPLCGGGCKRYRSFYFSKPGYCPYADFLNDAYPRMQQIAATLR